jgi:mono/diheme cytochrome c family protein
MQISFRCIASVLPALLSIPMKRFWLLFLLAALPSLNLNAADPAAVDYSRDIRPIFANSCYACHGPDEGQRKGKLRLDVREAAIKSAIVAGKAADSPLYLHITSKDPEEVMPPPTSKKPAVTSDQAKLIARWIDEGAKFDIHWAYVKPVRPTPPEVANRSWVRNPVDAFVAAGHEKHGFKPSPRADPVTLIRRLSFDLIGLPPTPAEVDAFTKAFAANPERAYERLVDRLVASEHFGERMAVYWLDLVRYADTGGYHSDNHRDVWLFRDFVINAFNYNMPFDQFTIEQLAGDLLPSAGAEQKIASGYNRMLMTTEEGGAQAKEYTAKYAADRVRNASSVWLGATLGCAECHNHKYDPFTSRDFYRFAAFFADVQEAAVGRQAQTPIMKPQEETELKKLNEEIAKVQAELAKSTPALEAAQLKWEESIKAKKDGNKGLPKPVVDALAVELARRNATQKQTIATHFRTQVAAETESLRKQLAAAVARKDKLTKSAPTTLIAMSGQPRQIRILPRGNWLDDSGEIVTADIPAFLGSAAPSNPKPRATRMDLAKWLVSADNPLTARVYVNRLWKLAFGQGLVKNLDDFGTQGTLPSHPELLDYLATEFVKEGWNTKKMLKLLVMSNAYRQSSATSKEVRERDPGNVWLSRQNRFRLDAEFVRDNALAVSGLLVNKIGGPGVRPYQPVGFWSFLNFPTREWQNDKGENQYRRGLYTYWCRSFLHPSLFAFDAPTREECTNERSRSSTPLQALVMLNDPTYVEASRAFAERIMKESGSTKDRITFGFKQALSRSPTAAEIQVLEPLFLKHEKEFREDKSAALHLITVGSRPAPKDVDLPQLAAWTSVGRVILNLHETITRN